MTKETNVCVKINVDGTGVADSSTSIPFLDHMLDVSDLTLLFCVLCIFANFILLVKVSFDDKSMTSTLFSLATCFPWII